jgi:hypothetical protein
MDKLMGNGGENFKEGRGKLKEIDSTGWSIDEVELNKESL